MSCQEKDKRSALLEHLQKHTLQHCPLCGHALECAEGSLPFGNDMITTWVCSVCLQEKVIMIKEDGMMFEG